MADALFSDLRTQLDTDLRDADNFTFTSAEKDEIVRAGIEDDPYVYVVERDTSLTTLAYQPTYTSPFDHVSDVGYDYFGDGYTTWLPSSNWEQIGDTLIFDRELLNLAAGKTMVVLGKRHLTKNDLIPGSQRAYIMHKCNVAALDMLINGKTNRFLRNDVTMAELQQARANHDREAEKLKKNLVNRRPMRF